MTNATLRRQQKFVITSYSIHYTKLYDNITQEAYDTINNDIQEQKKMSTVLFNPTWHKGVIGIVASRLTESFYRPTVILTESKGFATGSARSVDGFDLYKAIESCSDLLV